jgi:flagellar basal body rod protein FlgB
MKLQETVTDNIAELLVKIIEFTRKRQKILVRNINNIDTREYEPHDLAVEEFSSLINSAIDEHIESHRLLLFDTETIKFGVGGSLEIKAAPDTYAASILKENKDEYLEMQVNKLLENSLNQKIAAELLRQKLLRISDLD